MKASQRNILLVEDNDDDVFFMLRSVKAAKLPWQVQVVKDGQAAIDHLAAIAALPERRPDFPELILLDLKLPGKSGHEVLAWMRSTAEYKGSVVIMLTTSAEAKDIAIAYESGANAYVVKPTSVELAPMLEALNRFWFGYNCFGHPGV